MGAVIQEIVRQLEDIDDEMDNHSITCTTCENDPGECKEWYDLVERYNFVSLALRRTESNMMKTWSNVDL